VIIAWLVTLAAVIVARLVVLAVVVMAAVMMVLAVVALAVMLVVVAGGIVGAVGGQGRAGAAEREDEGRGGRGCGSLEHVASYMWTRSAGGDPLGWGYTKVGTGRFRAAAAARL
jgi:hypothetical protein